jgi:hypothetical protein
LLKHPGRKGQYRKGNLIAQFGPDIALPDLRHEIAQCERRGKTYNGCRGSLFGIDEISYSRAANRDYHRLASCFRLDDSSRQAGDKASPMGPTREKAEIQESSLTIFQVAIFSHTL